MKPHLDGLLVEKGHIKTDKTPPILTLPFQTLKNNKPVHLAIEVTYDTESLFPLTLNRGKEAFATSKQRGLFILFKSFITESMPLISAAVNFVIGLLFLFFWISARFKHEYFWLGIFCLAQTFAHISSIDFVYMGIGYDASWPVWMTNYLFEGFFGLLLGLSYARARLSLLYTVIFAALFAPVFLNLIAKDTKTIGAMSQMISLYFIPTAYAVGAIFSTLQWFYLSQRSARGANRFRKRMLLVFSFGMVLMLAFFLLESSNVFSGKYMIMARFIHVILIFALSIVVLSDYKKQAETVSSYKMSKYHSLGRAGEWIGGALLQVDLKESTKIARHLHDATGNKEIYGLLVRAWYDRFTAVAEKHGAEIMSEEGDAISLFFDESHGRHELPNLLDALLEMVATHQEIGEQFNLRSALQLRGSVSYGEIQPCWKGQGNSSRPGWDGTILIDGARTMELERKVEGSESLSIIIVSHDYFSKWEDQIDTSLIHDKSLVITDKDNIKRKVAALHLPQLKKSIIDNAS